MVIVTMLFFCVVPMQGADKSACRQLTRNTSIRGIDKTCDVMKEDNVLP